jgi:hypothetical protein
MYDTVEILCCVLLGVCIGTNDILGCTPAGLMLRGLADELDALKAANKGARRDGRDRH